MVLAFILGIVEALTIVTIARSADFTVRLQSIFATFAGMEMLIVIAWLPSAQEPQQFNLWQVVLVATINAVFALTLTAYQHSHRHHASR